VVVVERNAAAFVFSPSTPLSGLAFGSDVLRGSTFVFSPSTSLSGLAFGSDVLRGSTFGGLNVEDSFRVESGYCDFIGEGIIVPGLVLNETPSKEMQT
jgi:hypothetical protein